MSSGLPWIRLYRDLATHPKLLALECDLGEGALAYVIKLWCAAATHYRDGRIKGPPGLVARYAGWVGPPDTLIDALVACGLFERAPDGLVCHDWDEYQGAHIDRMDAEAARGRVRRVSRGHPVGRTQDGTQYDRKTSSVRPVGRGEEIREDKKREDLSEAAAPHTQTPRDASKPIWAQRAEPLSMHGPIPDSIEAVMAFEWRGEPLLKHFERAAPDLPKPALWDQAENALNHRGTCADRLFRGWYWPDGCAARMVDWLQNANVKHCRAEEARARLAKTGAYVPNVRTR